MSDVIKLVQGDTKPDIALSLYDETTGNPIDITAPTTLVKVKFRAAGSTTLLSTIDCTKIDPATAKVQFNFAGGVLDVEPGMYEGEIYITYADNHVQTVFDVLRFRVRQQF